MENPEEVLHSLEEFTKSKPKDIPRELEEYLCFVAKTGDPVYQWPAIKCLFREKLVSVITEFYEACPSVEIPPCPNVDMFNYDVMKNFILEKLDTFAAAPFTLQRISELLTAPRKEYNRIDKYMRALEKNVLVVSTTEPGGRRSTENGDGIVNGLESEHQDTNEIKVDEIENSVKWPELETNTNVEIEEKADAVQPQWSELSESQEETNVVDTENACTSTEDTSITCQTSEEPVETPYVSIEPVMPSDSKEETSEEGDLSVTITAIPATVETRRSSIEPEPESSESAEKDTLTREETTSSTEEEEVSNVDSSTNIEDDVPAQESLVSLTSTENTVEEPKEGAEIEETPEASPEEPVSCTANEEVKIWYESNEDEQEISSSDKTDVEEEKVVESSGLEEEETHEEEQKEAESVAEEAKEAEEISFNESEPMEVGEVYTNETTDDDIVKAEATSDSNL